MPCIIHFNVALKYTHKSSKIHVFQPRGWLGGQNEEVFPLVFYFIPCLRIEFPKVQPNATQQKYNKRADIDVEVYEHVSACIHKNKFEKIHRKVEFKIKEILFNFWFK